MCANDNLELACAFVQKTATEKAVIEIDKYLKNVSSFQLLKNIIYLFMHFLFCVTLLYLLYNFLSINYIFFFFFRSMKDVVCLEWKVVVIVIH